MIKGKKQKGARRERQCIDLLISQGYICTKAGGSLGIFDIVAISELGIKMIQVKSNNIPPPAERETIRHFAETKCPPYGSVEMWVIKDGKPKEPRIIIVRDRNG